MNHKRMIVILAVVIMAAVPMGLMMSDGSDARVSLDTPWGEGFTNSADGTLHVPLSSTEYAEQTITITVTEDGRELTTATFTVPAERGYTAELRFRLGSVGEHSVTVTCEPDYLFPAPSGEPLNWSTVTITVNESIWSKPSTYAAVIVVALLIVIAAYFKMRNAPATKPDVTFTELEKQKDTRAEEDKPKASATERRRYSGGSDDQPKKEKAKRSPPPEEKAKPAAPPEEKKAASFTELEKQKGDKKESSPKPSGEKKKLKYVSSRRK